MKKALQSNQKIFLRIKGRKYYRWDKDSIDVLIKLANDVPDYKWVNENGYQGFKLGSILKPYQTYEERVSLVTRVFLEKYIDKGATAGLLNELNEILSDVNFRHVLMPSGGQPHWEFIADFSRPLHAEEMSAILFSHLLSIGALERVKLCEMERCNRFFVGPPNRRWCSDTCGSKYRVRKKRKRDLE